jgi:hypothetical protein
LHIQIRTRAGQLLVAGLLLQASTVQGQAGAATSVCLDPDSLVRALYAAVTFERGTTPDWTFVRSLFHRDATVVLRVSRDSTAIMSVEGFVQDFKTFIGRTRADTTGFRERIVRAQLTIMGNIAHVLVLYEASVPSSPRPPQQGVDSFHLFRSQGRWWITSIVNEVVTRNHPVPAVLKE